MFDLYELLEAPIARGPSDGKGDAKKGALIWEVQARYIDSTKLVMGLTPPDAQLVNHFMVAGETELDLHASICERAAGSYKTVGNIEVDPKGQQQQPTSIPKLTALVKGAKLQADSKVISPIK